MQSEDVTVAFLPMSTSPWVLMESMRENDWVLFPLNTTWEDIGQKMSLIFPNNFKIINAFIDGKVEVQGSGMRSQDTQGHKVEVGVIYGLQSVINGTHSVTLLHNKDKHPPLPGLLLETLDKIMQQPNNGGMVPFTVYKFDAKTGQRRGGWHLFSTGRLSTTVCITCGRVRRRVGGLGRTSRIST